MLVQYLLGQMSEAERERLEARFFDDDEYFGQLNEVEDELIDNYLSRRLPPELHQQFEDLYLRIPDHRLKVELARALKKTSAKGISTPVLIQPIPEPSAPTQRTPSNVISMREVLARRVQFTGRQLALAAAAAVAVVFGGGWLLFELSQLQTQLQQARRQPPLVAPRDPALEQQAATQRTRAEQLARQLDAERLQRQQLEEKLAKLEAANRTGSATQPTAGESVLSFVLMPTLSRGVGDSEKLVVPAEARSIRFQLMVPSQTHDTSLSARIRTVEGNQVWKQATLPLKQTRHQKFVVINLKANVFNEDDYVVELYQTAPGSEENEVATYNLTIKRP